MNRDSVRALLRGVAPNRVLCGVARTALATPNRPAVVTARASGLGKGPGTLGGNHRSVPRALWTPGVPRGAAMPDELTASHATLLQDAAALALSLLDRHGDVLDAAVSPALLRAVIRANQVHEQLELMRMFNDRAAPEGSADAHDAAEAGLAALQASAARDVRNAALRQRSRARRHAAAVRRDDEAGRNVIAVLAYPGYETAVGLLAAWLLGAVALPLNPATPLSDLRYAVHFAGAPVLLCSAELRAQAAAVASADHDGAPRRTRVVGVPPSPGATTAPAALSAAAAVGSALPFAQALSTVRRFAPESNAALGLTEQEDVAPPAVPSAKGTCAKGTQEDALVVYTSGTTARPKGAVHTLGSLSNQVAVLHEAWGWRPDDRVLCVLPQHHVHGLINVTLSALARGAAVVYGPPKFDPAFTAARMAAGDVTTFHAVPPVHAKVVAAVAALGKEDAAVWKARCAASLRLVVSGSSALPPAVRDAFEAASGHVLLERFGMTEVGMALSQPVAPLERRVVGTVGVPLPTVEAAVLPSDDDTAGEGSAAGPHGPRLARAAAGQHGELLVASPSLIARYINRPAATAEAFLAPSKVAALTAGLAAADAAAVVGRRWFLTGDHVQVHPMGDVQIKGRLSADILKIGGFKVSALEVEAALLESGRFAEVAVFARKEATPAASDTAVCLYVPVDSAMSAADCAAVAEERLAKEQRPRVWVPHAAIPRNAMGKVNKRQLAALHFDGAL